MNSRRQYRPQLEPVESRALVSTMAGHLTGTVHGTFFAHRGSAATGTIYNVFTSGKVSPVGPTLLLGGFQTRGFTARGAGGGNFIFGPESRPGNVFLRVTEQTGPAPLFAASATAEFRFTYQITNGSGVARGSGTALVTLQPINTNLQGKPVSNPGFFGNATLTFA